MSRFFNLPTAALLCCTALSHASTPLAESIVLNHLVIVYRNGIPADAESSITLAGAHLTSRLDRFGMAAVSTTDTATETRLRAQPNIALVLHDRYVTAHAITLAAVQQLTPLLTPENTRLTPPIAPVLLHPGPFPVRILALAPTADSDYASPQGWAVRQAGGFGDKLPTAATTGPWNITHGAGIRIAILDTGVDAGHPDIAPNLALNLSEVNQSQLPSACDDGSPQDQQGHGTWTASLAAGALGNNTGLVAGVAPQATLLNIKVLERLPGTGPTPTAACEAGQSGGLLSWVLQGIDDAVSQHADVVSLSLGTLIDLTTGDGAGWKSAFDSVTYAAAQAGAILVAAVGNDGLNLSGGRYIELPAQARDVLPVTASTNPACAENIAANAICSPGPITRPYYSNYGSTLNAIAAPGGSYPEGPDTATTGFIRGACSSGLLNTTDGLPATGHSFGCFNLGHVQYVQAMGTSASAPLVAGAAAILRAAHPTWTAAKIITTLQTSATKPTQTMPDPQLNLPTALTLN